MVKRRKDNFSITPEMAARNIKRHNFWLAFEKLCARLDLTKDFFRLIRRRDPDATIGEISEFKRKYTRLLAYNYDVHRCPNPATNRKLFGNEPLNYPPEWRQA